MGFGRSRLRLFQEIAFALFCLLLYGCRPLYVDGLRAVYPEQRISFATPPAAFVPVESLQPTLRWEAFSPAESVETEGGKVDNVTYELRLAGDGFSYSRKGLRETFHRVEAPLKPSTRYVWTVRACFTLNGELRCTVWACVSGWDKYAPVHPNAWSYRFETPSEKDIR